ncbi:hypothetical protein LIER_09088 [Lithospermum erythrorhizon]|uniref:Retrotransposon Copia-like N-terminal domain-containing protein n=1 Tax=Lithospermum erythrorhizon TaxID=34254 RepID=A0AAV3PHA2_LITER
MSNQNSENNSNNNQAENVQNEGILSHIKVDEPLYLHNTDHYSLVLVTGPLTEHNYVAWSRSMIIALEARYKLGFLTGEIEAPDEDHVNHKQ